ncbi:porin family protein [Spirosoma sp. SC4-14]|uniref:porin family protein n=1 Tax=Spirosoma sp. SC4-14 TaxID=3128900 RepID=UPI0030CDB10D
MSKKSLAITGLLGLLVTQLYSQSPTSYHIGLKAGLNLANFIEPNTKENLVPLYTTGIGLEQRFTPKLSAFYELLYSRQGSTIPLYNDPHYTELAIRYNYLTLPVGVRYQSRRFPFLVEGGVQAGYLLNHHQEFLPANGTTTSQGTNLKKVDIGFLAGVGYRFSSSWLIEGKYYKSLATVFRGYSGYDPVTQSYVNRPPTTRYNQVISVTLSYYVN